MNQYHELALSNAGSLIQSARERAGRTRQDIAESIGLSLEEYCDIEDHPDELKDYTPETIASLLSLLGLSWREILRSPGADESNVVSLAYVELSDMVRDKCARDNISVADFEEQAGWDVHVYLEAPSAIPSVCPLASIIDVARVLSVDWRRLVIDS